MTNNFSNVWSMLARFLAVPCLFFLWIFFLQASSLVFVSSSLAQTSAKHPLHEAVRLGDFGSARALLTAGKKHLALEVDTQGMLPLHIAVSSGNIEMVRLLVEEYSVDPNQVADSSFSSKTRGRFPLHIATTVGDLGIVNFLLDSGADIFAIDIGGVTPLHLAIQYSHTSVADMLIKNMGARVHVRDKNGTTPLHVAARYGQDAIISRLLFLGRDKASSDGLHDILEDEMVLHKEMDNFLSSDHSQHTPDEHLSMLRKIRNRFEKIIASNDGASNSSSDRSFINAKNNFGLTPLHYAAAWGHKGAVTLLLSDGADVNAADRQGLTPLFLASRDGREDVVTLLSAQQGVNLERGDEEAHTPLCVAVANGHLRIFARLLNRGADPHAKDKNGMIPLHIASKRGNFEAVTSLLQQTQGLNINERDNKGNTPLHYAAGIGHVGLVESLLSSGADISVRNIKNETAGDLARASGHEQVLQFLR